MSILIYAFQAAGLLSIISTNVLMKSMTETAGSIYKSILHISSLDLPYAKDITKRIINLDLVFKLNVLNKFIKYNENEEREYLKEAINGVLEILSEINQGLKEIENAILYHESKYWNNWRSFECSYSLSKINEHNDILNIRINLLFKLIDIKK